MTQQGSSRQVGGRTDCPKSHYKVWTIPLLQQGRGLIVAYPEAKSSSWLLLTANLFGKMKSSLDLPLPTPPGMKLRNNPNSLEAWLKTPSEQRG